MSTQTTNWMTSTDRACLGQAALFQASILDYSPTSDEYADLTAAEHAEMAAEKAATEERAIDTCYGCPFMMQCEQWATENAVSGVAGGRTEAERTEIRAAKGLDTPAKAEPSVCAADRGPRNKVDDATVKQLTAMGWKSEAIAAEMGCTVRSVTRARTRIAAAEQAITTPAAAAPAPVAAPTPAPAPTRRVAPAPAPTVTRDPAVADESRAPRAGRVSPAMKAIYDALADGQWHDRASLLATGSLFVTDEEALAWWDKSIAPKSKNPHIGQTPREKRIADGRRDKVANALSASCRVRKHTLRGGPDGTHANLFRLANVPALAPTEMVTA
jgi:hypothetical protein